MNATENNRCLWVATKETGSNLSDEQKAKVLAALKRDRNHDWDSVINMKRHIDAGDHDSYLEE